MSEFSLRALAREVRSDLGDCEYQVLAKEIRRRIAAGDVDAALAELLSGFSRRFITARRPESLRERLERHSERVGDCLIWRAHARGGYGCIDIRNGSGGKSNRQVHRVSYEEFVGPIPEGLQVDHWCHSRDPYACIRPCIHTLCWNPEHLRLLTPAEHRALRNSPGRPRLTHCKRGHEFTPENTYIYPRGSRNMRTCIACREARRQEAA
jgi:hypothetical protein